MAVRGRLLRRPRPPAAVLPPQPTSSWSPILRRRDASSRVAEQGGGAAGSSSGGSTGSQHILSETAGSARSLSPVCHQTSAAPPPTVLFISVTWCGFTGFTSSSPKETQVNSPVCLMCGAALGLCHEVLLFELSSNITQTSAWVFTYVHNHIFTPRITATIIKLRN